MLYLYDSQQIDSVDLKALLVSRGVRVHDEVYEEFKDKVRLSKNPLECNTLQLPDGTIVQLTDLSFHMEYIQSILSWEMLGQLKYLPQLKTDFSLRLDDNKKPVLYFKQQKVTEVDFIEPSGFYRQSTVSGLPFVGNAVLQAMSGFHFNYFGNAITR